MHAIATRRQKAGPNKGNRIGEIPDYGRYRWHVFGFCRPRRGDRHDFDCQGPVDARRSLARHPARHRNADGRQASGDIVFFCHGTTVGTNALLERKGVEDAHCW